MRLASVVAGFAMALAAALATAEIPDPTVTGPIAASAIPGDASHNYVFFASDHPLAVNGYVEEEFFINGTANRYLISGTSTGTLQDSNHAYRTRIVVRRPADAKKFNGTVLVEWVNVTNGFDAENFWFFAWEHVLREGYAWVGVSAQRVGVNELKAWNANRYGTLDVTEGNTINNDALSYDIFMQAGNAVRRNPAVLGGLRPRTVLATGESQSAQRLATFINAVMPLGNVYDGVILLSNFGQPIRPDPVVPVWKLKFEWDLQTGEAAIRQPDSSKFHNWEIAGTAHVDHHLRLTREPLELRDRLVSSEANLAPTCAVPNIGSRVPNHYVVDAAIDHMVRWVRDGKQPPSAPLMEIASFGANGSALIARDQYEMALGGVRLSQIEVPTARNVGQSTSGGACPRWGYHLPFDVATLDSLYRSHGAYLDQVVRVTRDNLRRGFILKDDAVRTIVEAMQTEVGDHGKAHFDIDRDRDFGRD
jgi:Alpha/beta hydrolase domain